MYERRLGVERVFGCTQREVVVEYLDHPDQVRGKTFGAFRSQHRSLAEAAMVALPAPRLALLLLHAHDKVFHQLMEERHSRGVVRSADAHGTEEHQRVQDLVAAEKHVSLWEWVLFPVRPLIDCMQSFEDTNPYRYPCVRGARVCWLGFMISGTYGVSCGVNGPLCVASQCICVCRGRVSHSNCRVVFLHN